MLDSALKNFEYFSMNQKFENIKHFEDTKNIGFSLQQFQKVINK